MTSDRTPDTLADVADVLDDLALAYALDPDTVGRLLTAHAATVTALDLATVTHDGNDATRAMRTAEAAGTREALLAEIADDQLADVIPLAAARTAQNGYTA